MNCRTRTSWSGRSASFLIHPWADGPVGVIPDVVHAAGDQFVQPRFGEQFVDVCLANAGGHAGQQPRLKAVIQAAQCAAEHVLVATAFVAGDLAALDADERRGVAKTPQLARPPSA